MAPFDQWPTPQPLTAETIAQHECGLRGLEERLMQLAEPERSQALADFYEIAERLRAEHRRVLLAQHDLLN